MTPDTAPTSHAESHALRQNTVRDSGARAAFLAAVQELGKDGSDFTLERLRRLMQVEEHFQSLLLYDQLDFLRLPPVVAEAERDFALGVQRIALETANGFQRFLRTRSQWATTTEALDAMVRATGLALHAIHAFAKWGIFLAEPGRATPWRQLHALYALSESDGTSRQPFALHASKSGFTPSVQSLYLRTLFLDLINTGNLSKVQIEVADGWFSAWTSEYGLDAGPPSERHLFHVDLQSESGLHLMRDEPSGSAARFVQCEAMKAQIAEVRSGLQQGRLFAGYGSGAVFPIEEHTAVLDMIERFQEALLTDGRTAIEERTHFEDREVDVVIGIDLVMRKVREPPRAPRAPQAAAESPGTGTDTFELSPSGLSLVAEPAGPGPEVSADDPEVQRMRVLDLSSRGFGLLADRVTSETLPVHGVLALHNHDNGSWILGHVVRKLPHRVRGEMLLGVEILAYRHVPIALEWNGSEVQALYLPGAESGGKQDSILLRIEDFAPEKSFTLAAGGASYRVRVNRTIRKGADWIRARFEIESRT